MTADAALSKVRIDKWLWAVRLYKTRGLAQEAIEAGHVRLNGERAKPAKTLKVGDQILLKLNQLEYHLTVLALSERRGSATLAQQLYQESAASLAAREQRQLELKALYAGSDLGQNRPTKKDRRELDRFRSGGW